MGVVVLLGVLLLLGLATPAAADHAAKFQHVDGVALPDPHYTPGSTNPAVTQGNITRTICVPGWSKKARPPTSVTTPLKLETMATYHVLGQPADYEGDHLISIELGGCPGGTKATCSLRLNFWPQPWNKGSTIPGAHQKDVVENFLHKQGCAGALSLDHAQSLIAGDWYRVFLHPGDAR